MISIIIPVYNIQSYIEQCVRSAMAQSLSDIEIILVDDGSADGSGEMCDSLAKEDSRIKVIHSENRGLSAARNLGLKSSGGEYIYYLDGDDYIEPDTLKTLYAALCESGADFACGGLIKEFSESHCGVSCAERTEELSPSEFLCGVIGKRPGCSVSAWNKLYTRRVALENPYPEGLNFEDQATFVHLASLCEKIVLVPFAGYHYRILRPGSICSVTSPDKLWAMRTACEMAYSDFRRYFPSLTECLGQYEFLRAVNMWTECVNYEYKLGTDARVTQFKEESRKTMLSRDSSRFGLKIRLLCGMMRFTPRLAEIIFICIQKAKHKI